LPTQIAQHSAALYDLVANAVPGDCAALVPEGSALLCVSQLLVVTRNSVQLACCTAPAKTCVAAFQVPLNEMLT